MPIFQCSKCGCVENTALSNYWVTTNKDEALCSECDPLIGRWHGSFEKQLATGLKLGNDGFLYHPDEVTSGSLDWRVRNAGFKIVKDIE